jgi:hypothetical protein
MTEINGLEVKVRSCATPWHRSTKAALYESAEAVGYFQPLQGDPSCADDLPDPWSRCSTRACTTSQWTSTPPRSDGTPRGDLLLWLVASHSPQTHRGHRQSRAAYSPSGEVASSLQPCSGKFRKAGKCLTALFRPLEWPQTTPRFHPPPRATTPLSIAEELFSLVIERYQRRFIRQGSCCCVPQSEGGEVRIDCFGLYHMISWVLCRVHGLTSNVAILQIALRPASAATRASR